MIHDAWVAAYWAFDEPLRHNEYRSRALIESAVNRPMQSAFGMEIHPTILDKAAALFHSLITNHPFTNGNKRTAVVTIDLYLLANDYCLVLGELEMYQLAKQTAQHNERGISSEEILKTIAAKLKSSAVPLSKIGGSKELDELKIFMIGKRKRIRQIFTFTAIVDGLKLNWAP